MRLARERLPHRHVARHRDALPARRPAASRRCSARPTPARPTSRSSGCARHSSGAIGFPLRLLAREVYDRVCAIKGDEPVALITGEERIEPQGRALAAVHRRGDAARRQRTWRSSRSTRRSSPPTASAGTSSPTGCSTRAAARRRCCSARRRSSRWSARWCPRPRSITRPRFSTLSHAGATQALAAAAAHRDRRVLGRAGLRRRRDAAPLPRRRGGGDGRAQPRRRATRQVALFQSGEVDYIVATDAIGMGLNLDVDHVAFAGADQVRRRAPAAADPGRDGADRRARRAPPARRHVRHARRRRGGRRRRVHRRRGLRDRGAPLRAADPAVLARGRAALRQPRHADRRSRSAARRDPSWRRAPEAIDLAVLKRLAEEPAIAGGVRGAGAGAAVLGGLPPARLPPAGRRHPRALRRAAVAGLARRPPRRRLRRRARSPSSTAPRATSTRCRAASPRSAAGPTSPSAPTGCSPATRWPRAPARSRRGCPTRCTRG